jgi:DNA-binding response OmpR family regulator
MRALLFSRDLDETAVLTVVLQRSGFEVRATSNMENLIQGSLVRPPDLLVFALVVDEQSVPAKIKQLRAQIGVPIVVIGELQTEDYQVNLLEAGADMLVARPYGVRSLVSQLRALIRRLAGVPFFSLPVLTQGSVRLDPSTHTVALDEGQPKRLTQLEFRLLYALMTYTGRVVPTETLVEHVWGYSGEGDRGLVRGLIQRLRAKIEPNPAEPHYILTQTGVGYSFNLQESD